MKVIRKVSCWALGAGVCVVTCVGTLAQTSPLPTQVSQKPETLEQRIAQGDTSAFTEAADANRKDLIPLIEKFSSYNSGKLALAKLGVKSYLDEIVVGLTTTNSPLLDAYKNGLPITLSDAKATQFSDDPQIADIQGRALKKLAYVRNRSTVKIVAAFLYSPQELTVIHEDLIQLPPSSYAISTLRQMVDNPPQSDDVKVWQQWWEKNKDKYP